MNTELVTLIISGFTLVVALIIGVLQIRAAKQKQEIQHLERKNERLKQQYLTALNSLDFFFRYEDVLLDELSVITNKKKGGLKIKYRRKIDSELTIAPRDVRQALANII
jgi:uncharacterized membrane-anchored protein YhcB (DUF1043 family)